MHSNLVQQGIKGQKEECQKTFILHSLPGGGVGPTALSKHSSHITIPFYSLDMYHLTQNTFLENIISFLFNLWVAFSMLLTKLRTQLADSLTDEVDS